MNNGYIHAFDLSNPAQETWTLDNAFNNTHYGLSPDVTYRATRTKIVLWQSWATIYCNYTIWSNRGEVIKENGYLYHPRISTNTQNQRDIAVVWRNEWGYQIEENSYILCMQEIFP